MRGVGGFHALSSEGALSAEMLPRLQLLLLGGGRGSDRVGTKAQGGVLREGMLSLPESDCPEMSSALPLPGPGRNTAPLAAFLPAAGTGSARCLLWKPAWLHWGSHREGVGRILSL